MGVGVGGSVLKGIGWFGRGGSHVCSGAIAQFFERGEASQEDSTDLMLTGETQSAYSKQLILHTRKSTAFGFPDPVHLHPTST